jgi:hypothetical protein
VDWQAVEARLFLCHADSRYVSAGQQVKKNYIGN